MSITIPGPEDLRRLRLKAGLTQKELARRAGVSQSLIARIERGDVNPRLTTLKKILRVLEEALSKGEEAKAVMKSPVITLNENDTVTKAVELMEKYAISQIPVLDENGRVIGTILESSLLRLATNENRETALRRKVKEVMDPPLPMIAPDTRLELVINLLTEYPAVLVISRGQPIGIITKIDIIRYKMMQTS